MDRFRANNSGVKLRILTLDDRPTTAFAWRWRYAVESAGFAEQNSLFRNDTRSGMKRFGFVLFATIGVIALGNTAAIRAQAPAKDASAEAKPTSDNPPKEESSVTDHTIKIGTDTIPYKATAGTILLKDATDKPIASIFYVAYIRSDLKDTSDRPLAFVYNGGPGSSSAPLHMGAFGPKRIVTSDAEATPPAPFRLVDNANCLLDAADLVFIDPVGTGYSKAVGDAKGKDFWGIDQDAKSLSQFITTYVNRNNRWNSPKFLIGESYGTFRDAVLVDYLQNHENMYFNGVVMISTVLDFQLISFNPGEDLSYVLFLPSYAAAAWYQKTLTDRPADLDAFLAEARQFASTDYAMALAKGSALPAADRAEIVHKLAHFTGLSEDYISNANLRVSLFQFMSEVQRAKGLTTGRLDARFTGPIFDRLEEYAAYDPLETAIMGAFAGAFNQYVRGDLQFNKDQSYEMLSDQVNESWNWDHKVPENFAARGAPNAEADLVDALFTNTHLQVEVENGYFDLGTPFFATEYTMDHLNLPANLRSNIHLQYYNAGHMMYLHEDDLTKLKGNIANFIANASKH
jgi:carboxypeptidase C (cathepsin A)